MENPTTKPNPAATTDHKPGAEPHASVTPAHAGSYTGAQITDEAKNDILDALDIAREAFGECAVLLSTADRRRLIGARMLNQGFIEVARESAADNPALVPAYINAGRFERDYADFEDKRMLLDRVNALRAELADSVLAASDRVYRDALAYYEALKVEARHVPGVAVERDRLADYFKTRARKSRPGAPTEKQVERDVRALLHGTKEGEVVVRNVRPTVAGGGREVVDEVK